jgi:hypothetical protein
MKYKVIAPTRQERSLAEIKRDLLREMQRLRGLNNMSKKLCGTMTSDSRFWWTN